jgi:type I restriction enzyme M protein
MEREGSRIAVVTNGSPLFTGAAGSGESDIRRWIIENDWLECIVALPKDLFYNTGINTYIWFLTNNKAPHRKGKVQLINGDAKKIIKTEGNGKDKEQHLFCQPNKKSLGNKRNEITSEHIAQLLELYQNFEESDHSKIFDNDYFGYYQLIVEQPKVDENGKMMLDKKGNPKPDTKKRDSESVPLTEDVETYFETEVKPHVPNAWIDYDKTRIGYEINFTKYFYNYIPLRPAKEIKTEIITLENDIANLLKDLIS